MTQPGMPPVAGVPGMPPAGYQGKAETIFSVNFKFASIKFNMFYAFVLNQMFKIMCWVITYVELFLKEVNVLF